MAESYTKTVFVNGQAPALSAEELNKMGQGVEDAFEFSRNSVNFLFGNGMDGNVTISANTNLTRDMYYENLTINSGIKLSTNGYKIFVRGTLTNNGIIEANGPNGTNGSSTDTYTQYSNNGGGSGGGSTSNGGGTSPGFGGNGGNGGRSVYDATVKTGGAASYTVAALQSFELIHNLYNISPQGGGGGAGGTYNSNPYYSGGSGGVGGGRVLIYARNIINSGSIEAKGGNGGNGVMNASYWSGGGGGGGGGFVLLVHNTFTGNEPNVSGGAGGTAYSSTGNGVAGTVGSVRKIKLF
ncbi:hypothetical protein ACFOU2_09640 [Bacillus songklensis]|uniref:Uncharacterized protein n=1 Tax=Bacillus songklensis TaxID=1069116 RepID=A0ABV8B238_9BACI